MKIIFLLLINLMVLLIVHYLTRTGNSIPGPYSSHSLFPKKFFIKNKTLLKLYFIKLDDPVTKLSFVLYISQILALLFLSILSVIDFITTFSQNLEDVIKISYLIYCATFFAINYIGDYLIFHFAPSQAEENKRNFEKNKKR